MRGPQRIVVAGLLVVTGALTGGLAGFVAGVPASAVGPSRVSTAVAVAVIGAAVVLDAVAARRPGWRPPSVRRQVPQAWGRLFGAHGAAVLYGARLGVGPLTFLRSWLWWAGTGLLALHGAWWSALGGAAYAVAALCSVAATASAMGADGAAAAGAVARLRRAEPVVLLASSVVLGAAAATLAITPG